jgi:SAM-dependent methyltransferase
MDIFQPDFFISEPARPDNAFRLFPDWICRVPLEGVTTGQSLLFYPQDRRPTDVVDAFGTIEGWRTLELGSLEGAHTYQLENMGADVLGIEANPASFLKSLVVKNALSMRSRFLLGECLEYLTESSEQFDLIFASGVLYHMRDPVELLYQISRHTDRVMLWTHYASERLMSEAASQFISRQSVRGVTCNYYRYDYPENWGSRAFAGTASWCSWISKEDIIGALKAFGFGSVRVVLDDTRHPSGDPAITLMAAKSPDLFVGEQV